MNYKIGATYSGNNKTEFWVFAPFASEMHLLLFSENEQRIGMLAKPRGFFYCVAEDCPPGTQYQFAFNGQSFADPASRCQPDGVFGPSAVVNHDFYWQTPNWEGRPIQEYIIYELHVGCFTKEGTFDAIIKQLDHLIELGITAIELMPIAQFSGDRNWGYDGVFPFAPQNTYGSSIALKQLIDTCHQRGLCVILDVIYNHFGPEGNILGNFGPYFSNRYQTPWGSAINFDGPYSDAVQEYFIQNALMWLQDYHFDALRLDALHTVFDYSAYPFLSRLTDRVHAFAHQAKRKIYLFAESDLNDTKLIRAHSKGGYALDAQWNDDFHHALHAMLTPERYSYGIDFGKLAQLSKAYKNGYVYTGQYSKYRKCRHGQSSRSIPATQFVVFLQNHDQIGNRPQGERISQLVNFEQLKLAAAFYILSPYIPMLFMGEEYAETTAFIYFTSHQNTTLINNVLEGRKTEMLRDYGDNATPDPQDATLFQQCKLNQTLCTKPPHQQLFNFYKTLIMLRKTIPVLASFDKRSIKIINNNAQKTIFIYRWHGDSHIFIFANFSEQPVAISNNLQLPEGRWKKIIDSTSTMWKGPGETVPEHIQFNDVVPEVLPAFSFILFKRL